MYHPTLTEGGHPENFYSEMAAGPELAFARALLRSGLSSKVGFIPAAIGGQGLFKDYCPKVMPCVTLCITLDMHWTPHVASNGHHFDPSSLEQCGYYQRMVHNTKKAIAAFKGRAVLRGMLFVQV